MIFLNGIFTTKFLFRIHSTQMNQLTNHHQENFSCEEKRLIFIKVKYFINEGERPLLERKGQV